MRGAGASSRQQIESLLHSRQHAQREHIYFEQAERLQIGLVPLDHLALGHRRVLDRHQVADPVLRDHEPTDVLRQMSREIQQLLHQRAQPPNDVRIQVQPLAGDTAAESLPVVPIRLHLREAVDHVRVEPQRLADVADRALRPIGDDGCSQRRALAPVLLEYVLDDFLASFVLEVDVDVRRLVALRADEALEQRGDVARVDFGDAQGVAHDRIGRRAAALAQDRFRPAARPLHDLVDREKEMLVLQFLDERELLVHDRTNFLRHALRPAPFESRLGQVAQMLAGLHARRDQLARIAIAQLVERELAALRDVQRFIEQLPRINFPQLLVRAQMPLAVREQTMARCSQRATMANSGKCVLQRAPFGRMHVHIAGCHERQAMSSAELSQARKASRIVGSEMQLDCNPAASGKQLAHPSSRAGTRFGRRHPYCETVIELRLEISARQSICALVCRETRASDQRADFCIGGLRRREQHDVQIVERAELRADDQFQTPLLGGVVRSHDAGHRAFVRQRERRIAESRGLRDQLARMRRSAQEREVAEAMQLRIRDS